MIEVIRQALSDIGELLKAQDQILPNILDLEFDNCGEFKNKFMMAYCSLLVESGRFVLVMFEVDLSFCHPCFRVIKMCDIDD